MTSLDDIDLTDMPVELLRELRRKVGEQVRARRHKYDQDTIIAMVRSGTAIKDCGVPYSTAFKIVCEYEKATGERLPRSNKGQPRNVQRCEAIITAYKAHPNFTDIGKQFSLTDDRIRQIIARHESETGEKLPRRTAVNYSRGPRVARVLWICAGECGKTRLLLPSVAAQHERCHKCNLILRGSRITDELMEDTIEKILAGGTNWLQLALAVGYSKQAAHRLHRAVYTYVQHQDRLDLIPRLWPKGVPPWLQKFTLKPKRMAAE